MLQRTLKFKSILEIAATSEPLLVLALVKGNIFRERFG
jgi:hypothetical protein